MQPRKGVVSTFRLTLTLAEEDDGVGDEGPSASIIISHAVVRGYIPGHSHVPAESNVDSMLFPLITFIIRFKVSRPLVRSVLNISFTQQNPRV